MKLEWYQVVAGILIIAIAWFVKSNQKPSSANIARARGYYY
jgi:hypothetical protein